MLPENICGAVQQPMAASSALWCCWLTRWCCSAACWAGRCLSACLQYGQHGDLLRMSVVGPGGQVVPEEDALSPAYWQDKAQVQVDMDKSYKRGVFVGYELRLEDPECKQSFTAPCTMGSSGLPAGPFFVEAQHEEALVAAELAAFAAITAVKGLAARYHYELYLESPAEPVPESVRNCREMLVTAWLEARALAV